MTNTSQITAEWMRRPLADLNDMSPSDAAADPSARKKLEDLLTELAGHYVRLSNLGLPAIDPQEIRKALGIAALPGPAAARPAPRAVVRAGPVKRNALLEELGSALTGGDVDSVAFFNKKTGVIEHFMYNLGEQEDAKISQAENDEDLQKVAPVTTEVRYSIMSDFIGSIEDINVAGRLRTAISGKGAFRRFREAVDEDDALRRRWLAYRTKRHYYIALDWLHQLGLTPGQYGVNVSDYDWKPAAATSGQTPFQPAADAPASPPDAASQSATISAQAEADSVDVSQAQRGAAAVVGPDGATSPGENPPAAHLADGGRDPAQAAGGEEDAARALDISG